MIIPVRCVTCNKVLADKWTYYERECKKLDTDAKRVVTVQDLDSLFVKDKQMASFDAALKKDILDRLGLTRICCRRHMLGHVELIGDI